MLVCSLGICLWHLRWHCFQYCCGRGTPAAADACFGPSKLRTADLCAPVQVVYVGDGNNIVHSWIRLAAKFPFEFVCACPKGFEPDEATVALVNGQGVGKVIISNEPSEVRRLS